MSVKGTNDALNALVKEAHVVFKNTTRPNAFVNKKQWSMIWMKEEYHARFMTILQIIYHQKRLDGFSNWITITHNLAN